MFVVVCSSYIRHEARVRCCYSVLHVFGVQETITAGIHSSDYEQMKMNNKSLDEKLEERNEVAAGFR